MPEEDAAARQLPRGATSPRRRRVATAPCKAITAPAAGNTSTLTRTRKLQSKCMCGLLKPLPRQASKGQPGGTSCWFAHCLARRDGAKSPHACVCVVRTTPGASARDCPLLGAKRDGGRHAWSRAARGPIGQDGHSREHESDTREDGGLGWAFTPLASNEAAAACGITAVSKPIPTPTVSLSPRRITRPSTCRGCAPSARRMPSSRVRCPTEQP